MEQSDIIVRVATAKDTIHSVTITEEMEASAKVRGTGIAKRSPEYVSKKMEEGKAIIAVTKDGQWVGFSYIESWQHEEYVANSGLIVSPKFRHLGVAKRIKHAIFELSRKKYPDSKIFGLTTGLAVMKINSELGYRPVTYSELTTDDQFWEGCKSCVNYPILLSKGRKNCLCTAMLYDPKEHVEPAKTEKEFNKKSRLYERFMRLKKNRLLKFFNKGKMGAPNENGISSKPSQKKSVLSFLTHS